MTSAAPAVELRDGSLWFCQHGQPPRVPKGYSRDPENRWRLVLVVSPGPCDNRSSDRCQNGRPRWYCRKRDLPTNPGACCRCQGILEAHNGD